MDASYIPIAEARGFTTHWIKGVLQKQNKREILKIKSEKKAAEKGLQKMGEKGKKNPFTTHFR